MHYIATKHFNSPVAPMRFQQNSHIYQALLFGQQFHQKPSLEATAEDKLNLKATTLQFGAKREYTALEKELLAYKHQTILNVRQLSIQEAHQQLKESRQRLDTYLKTGSHWPLPSDGEQAVAKERILYEQLQRKVQPNITQSNFTIPNILRWLGIGVALGTALVIAVRKLTQPGT